MTPKSRPRVRRTEEEKLALIRAFANRGKVSAEEFARKNEVSVQMLYTWKGLHEKGESLAPKRFGPKNKAHTLVVTTPQESSLPPRHEIQLNRSLSLEIRCALLEEENARLKRMVEVSIGPPAN